MANWKWYIGFAPSIGWELAFQADADLLASLASKDAPERIVIRKPSKLEAVKLKGESAPILKCTPWMPKFFGALDENCQGVLSRNLFVWVQEATETAAADWDDSWKPSSGLVIVDEASGARETEALAQEVRAKSELAKQLRSPQLKKV